MRTNQKENYTMRYMLEQSDSAAHQRKPYIPFDVVDMEARPMPRTLAYAIRREDAQLIVDGLNKPTTKPQ